MDDPKQHVIDTLKEANNILVTVKTGPTVDQLAACIALTLVLNDLGKHGTAVFSGEIPSVLEFLEPDKTIEKNTDSLQDFIISLDKAKADKLRYKIEDTVVKIFITPYRTSLSPSDLKFEPGDFNVDVVVALGVHNQDDVDTAITEHGRILHDATVLSINTEGGPSEDLGSIAWIDQKASSLSEMVSEIANELGKDDAIDNQVATALLTGIVAETERFGNSKTTPETMQVASRLLTAGANQELVATKLAEPAKPAPLPEPRFEEAPRDTADNSGTFDVRSTGNDSHADGENHDGQQQDNGLAGLAEPASEKQPGNDGALEIEHPVTPLSAFAQENADFDIPKPAEDDSARPQPSNDGIPPIYDPGQEAPRDQEQAASFPQPPLATAEGQAADFTPQAPQVAPGQDDEQAALSFLNDHKVDPRPKALLEPLAPEPEQKPVIAPLHKDTELPELAEGQNPDNLKFGLAPPSMGGTLTANLPNERAATKLEKTAVQRTAQAPILARSAPQPSGRTLLPTPAASKPAEVEAVKAPDPDEELQFGSGPVIKPDHKAEVKPEPEPELQLASIAPATPVTPATPAPAPAAKPEPAEPALITPLPQGSATATAPAEVPAATPAPATQPESTLLSPLPQGASTVAAAPADTPADETKPADESPSSLLGMLPAAPTPTLADLEKQVNSSHTQTPENKKTETAVQTASLITPLIGNDVPVPAPSVSLPKPAARQAATPPPAPPPLATSSVR